MRKPIGYRADGRPIYRIGGGDPALDAIVDRVMARIGQQALQPVLGQRATSSTPSTPYYTGPNSLFGALGLERDVISTRINPFGLAGILPVQMTNVLWPQFPYFTGFGAGTGVEPNGVCDDPPTAGAGAAGVQTAQFGRFSRQTRVLDIRRQRQQMNRADFQDMTLLNGPLIGGDFVPPSATGNGFDIRNEAAMRMLEVGIEFQTWFSQKVYTGNPANNTGGGGYREFPGLDILVNTGHTDSNTNVTMPSLDSLIHDFNYVNVTTTPAAMTNVIDSLTKIMHYMRLKASYQNMDPVDWVLVMRPGLFYELTAGWPCTYATYRCVVGTAPANAVANINANGMDMAQMRDAMRQGQYLLMDGVQVPVVLDNVIHEASNTTNNKVTNGSFASDIYLLPRTAKGRSVLYWEFFDYRAGLSDLSSLASGAGSYYWTDAGRYLWHLKPPTNWCIQVLGSVEPRIILHTPHLAARLTNIQYQTPYREPDPIVGDPYNVLGGNPSGFTAPSFHTLWGVTS